MTIVAAFVSGHSIPVTARSEGPVGHEIGGALAISQAIALSRPRAGSCRLDAN